MTIRVGDIWSMYGYLNNSYPSPFNSRGRRWRNVEEFITANGRDRATILEGVTEKFKSNIHLLNLLEETDSTPIESDDPTLSSVLMEVRTLLSNRRDRGDSAFSRIMVRLSSIVREMGFTTALWGGRPTPLIDLEEGDYIIELRGSDKEGTLDIHISSPISDSKVKSIIAPYKKEGLTRTYLLVGNLSRGSVARTIAQLSYFHSIKYYSPSELLIDFKGHILSPHIEVCPDTDPIHQVPIGCLSEISSDDPLIKQLGYPKSRGSKRTILMVYDFNPHYRVVV